MFKALSYVADIVCSLVENFPSNLISEGFRGGGGGGGSQNISETLYLVYFASVVHICS